MAATVKQESEVCALCNSAESGLFLPEDYDAGAAPNTLPPMKTMLLHLAHNKPLPEGRICGNCAQRAVDAYEFSTQISSNASQPLSEKIRSLRKRLHELTQRIDVFIVVGAGSDRGYQEEDIIMVQKDKLAAAVAADEKRTSKWLSEEYQCSVCPKAFKSVELLNVHLSSHSPGAVHSCWWCGAQFPTALDLTNHRTTHCLHALICHLCNNHFESEGELERHRTTCPAVCGVCGCACVSHTELSAHARHAHSRTPPTLCPHCFLVANTECERAWHVTQHRAGTHYVCGADGCVLRYRDRSSLTAHVRTEHGAATRHTETELSPEPEPEPDTRRHANTHVDAHGASTRTRTRRTGQHVEPQPSLEPAAAAAAATSSCDSDCAQHVEYLEMDTFDDD